MTEHDIIQVPDNQRPFAEPAEATRLLLRADEAAHLLGVSRATVYNLLASGEIPGVKIGRAVRISRSTLLRWIAEQEQQRALQ